jgi:hypothetical protein
VSRTLAALVLLLALLAGAVVVFCDAPKALDGLFGNQQQTPALERELAKSNLAFPPDRIPDDLYRSSDSGRLQVSNAPDSGDLAAAFKVNFYAHLKIQLFGENDLPLQQAAAGILQMPEPGQNSKGLQALFFTMQGLKPKGFPVNEVLTDEHGYAVLPLPVSRQGWVVYGRVPGRMIAFQTVSEMPVEAGVEYDAGVLVLKLGGRLEVEVVEETGAPVAGASVVLVTHSNDDPMEMPILFLRTGVQGQAVFSNLSFRKYKIEVAKHGYLPFRQPTIAITERGNAYLKAMISRGGSISGRVVGSEGQPLAGVAVGLQAKDSKLNPEGLTQSMLSDSDWAVSDSNGKFSGSGLSAKSTYALRAQLAPNIFVESKEHQINDFVVLKMPSVLHLTGAVVRADGLPAAGAQVGLWEAHKPSVRTGRVYRAAAQADGRFELLVESGEFLLMAHDPSGAYMASKAINLQKNQDLGVLSLFQGGDLKLSVFGPDGRLAEQAFIVKSNTLKKIPWQGRPKLALDGMRQMRRDSNGQGRGFFSLQGLPPGDFHFQIYAPEYLTVRQTVRIIAGQVVSHRVQLVQGATLDLTLQDETGKPISNRRSKFRLVGPPESGRPEVSSIHPFRPDPKGELRFDRLVPGTWVLEAKAEDEIWVELDRYQLHAGSQSLVTVLDSI